jgi:ribonuclease E
MTTDATRPVTGPSPITVPTPHHARRQQCSDHHTDAVHRKRGTDEGCGQAKTPHGIGHEHRQKQERRRIEDELGDENRAQQRMMQHEGGAFPDLLKGVPARRGLARRLVKARQQHHRDHREGCRASKGGSSPHPSDQETTERGAAGKGNGAGEFDAGVGCRQHVRCDQRGNQCGRGDAVDDRSTDRNEAEQAEQGQREPAEPDQCEDRKHTAQSFRCRHQLASRDAVGEQTGGNSDKDKGQGESGLQQSGLAFADAEQQHGDDRRGRERDLFGRLRRQVGPGQAVEGGGQAGGLDV